MDNRKMAIFRCIFGRIIFGNVRQRAFLKRIGKYFFSLTRQTKHAEPCAISQAKGFDALSALSQRNRSIDALRAIAALLIVFHHSCVPFIGVSFYDASLGFFVILAVWVSTFFCFERFLYSLGKFQARKTFDSKNYC